MPGSACGGDADFTLKATSGCKPPPDKHSVQTGCGRSGLLVERQRLPEPAMRRPPSCSAAYIKSCRTAAHCGWSAGHGPAPAATASLPM